MDEPLGFDCVIDATGIAAVIETGFVAVKIAAGHLMIFGVALHEATISLSPFRIYNQEITIWGSMAVLFFFLTSSRSTPWRGDQHSGNADSSISA